MALSLQSRPQSWTQGPTWAEQVVHGRFGGPRIERGESLPEGGRPDFWHRDGEESLAVVQALLGVRGHHPVNPHGNRPSGAETAYLPPVPFPLLP